jgi:hypothetical protein
MAPGHINTSTDVAAAKEYGAKTEGSEQKP